MPSESRKATNPSKYPQMTYFHHCAMCHNQGIKPLRYVAFVKLVNDIATS